MNTFIRHVIVQVLLMLVSGGIGRVLVYYMFREGLITMKSTLIVSILVYSVFLATCISARKGIATERSITCGAVLLVLVGVVLAFVFNWVGMRNLIPLGFIMMGSAVPFIFFGAVADTLSNSNIIWWPEGRNK